MGILIHGDAAFAGQGIVPESLAMYGLESYKTGGTFHVIVNNQIGFTTFPSMSRSSMYASDISKFIEAPIFHVNGDDPESVCRVMKMAADFHTTFQHDVIIDLVCYRRYGHNESDEPLFTQPKMYQKIKDHPTTRTLYEQRLVERKLLTKESAQTLRDDADILIKDAFDLVQKVKSGEENLDKKPDWLAGRWDGVKGLIKDKDILKPVTTGVDVTMLRAIGLKTIEYPTSFKINSKIQRQFDIKRDALNSGENIDWATGESLAFASLLLEGAAIRLAGQDSERGTFSHRHAVITDQDTEQKFTPLNHIQDGQAKIEIVNSFLSELGVLGFEYGYSSTSPKSLVCWEAQFGDFSNGAQIIIDQFITSAETKWLRLSGLVMLLPHGFEGQGPEHSSARLERYLQMCAENNMFVANCTTPANYFHILRRQHHATYRKPLILMTPKSLLRHKMAVSKLSDMGKETTFLPVIGERHLDPKNIERVVICSGKVYYDLLESRAKHNVQNVALVRLEQFYPFPADDLAKALKPYGPVPTFWCQEEPENMGGWQFVDRRIEKVLTELHSQMMRPIYVGRDAAASPATGLASRHAEEQNKFINQALMIA
jgi:2-oxoglutarate dehydrogenase E1 component